MAKSNFPKGTTPRKSWDFPPDIFWITPDGVAIDIIGHVTAMQAHPETFGLDRGPVSKKEIDEAFHGLWAAGWVRGRFSDGTFYFQMERPRGVPMGNAHELVLRFARYAKEVDVDFFDPRYARMAKRMSAADFMEQRFPIAWGLNPRRTR